MQFDMIPMNLLHHKAAYLDCGPNEEQAKNERKNNEYRSRCRRETIGNSTICHRHGWQNTLLQPQNSILPLTLLLPRQIAALQPQSSILTANQAFSTHSAHFTHHESPSEALKTPRRHTAQQPTKTRHIRPKHPLTSTKTQSFAASIVGQTPRFHKVREQSQVHSNPAMAKKMP